MKLAEELYQGGYVSYPRTETNLFAHGYDLQGLVAIQAESDAPWAPFAQRLLQQQDQQQGEPAPAQSSFRWPKSGGKDDGAHPPIHPTRAFTGDGDKKRLYDFIVRCFLACCAADAEGQETRVAVDVGGEEFNATGLMVTARNWLDVYPWTNWGGEGTLPVFLQGQTFTPAEIRLVESSTQPPPRMRESDLLAKMDTYGIGTDATVADHIAKQLDRGYAVKDEASLTFAPTALGESLISAYRKMGLGNLWVPTLRGIIEQNITAVARGLRSKEEVLAEAVEAFSADFQEAASKSGILEQEVRAIVFNGGGAPPPGHANVNGNGNGMQSSSLEGGVSIGRCQCGAALLLVPARDGRGPIIACDSPPALHGERKELPARVTQSATVSATEVCSGCSRRKVDFQFTRALLPPSFQHMAQCTCCVACDVQLAQLLSMIGPAPFVRRAPPPAAGGGRGGGRGVRGGGAARGGRGRGRGGGTGTGARVNSGRSGGRGRGQRGRGH